MTRTNEKLIKNNFKLLDNKNGFILVSIIDLHKYNILVKPINIKIKNNEIINNTLKNNVYREY